MKALVLCAGKGERLKPLTNTRPKHLIPLAGKPLIEYIVDAIDPYVSEITFVTHHMKELLENHIKNYIKNAKFIHQEKPLGTGHAISLSPYSEFLCIYGDLVFNPSIIPKLIDFYNKTKKNVIVAREVENPGDFGVIYSEGENFLEIREKEKNPSSNLVNAGIYIFKKNIFEAIKNTEFSRRGELEITSSLNMIKDDVSVLKYRDFWLDVGRPWDILDANKYLLKNIEHRIDGEIEKNVTIKNPVKIGEKTLIMSGSYIEGPVFIGKNCRIGPNAYIRPYTSIGDNCHIGMSEVKNSVVFSNSNLPHFNYVGDSIVGEKVNFGAGAKVANLRHDGKNVKMEIKDKLTDSGRRKLGCVVGDNAKLGINVSIFEGRKIENNSKIPPHFVVLKNFGGKNGD